EGGDGADACIGPAQQRHLAAGIEVVGLDANGHAVDQPPVTGGNSATSSPSPSMPDPAVISWVIATRPARVGASSRAHGSPRARRCSSSVATVLSDGTTSSSRERPNASRKRARYTISSFIGGRGGRNGGRAWRRVPETLEPELDAHRHLV